MNSSKSNDREKQLGEILADYMQRVDAGETVDHDALLAAHPEFVDDLKSYFDAAEQVEDLAGPPGETMGHVAATASSLTSIRYFGDYELLEEIARGGMGVVYRARQTSLNRVVAVKMILAGQLAGEEDVQRFYSEAQSAANLDHPGIAPIYEVGSHQGQHYFSMAFVDGASLAAKIKDGPLGADQAVSIMTHVSEAVDYAHQQGVVHRDLKPTNILLDENGRPRVTDFGLAKRLSQDSSLTATGQIVGTPSFMPPEQAKGETEKVGPASDVYSLGATLYALLTGHPPFQAASVPETLRQVAEQEPVPVRRLNSAVPKDLETITLKCLHKEASRRYPSASELHDDLQRFRDGKPIHARPVGRVEKFVRWSRRNPTVASLSAAVTVLLLLATIGSVVFANFQRIARKRAESAESKVRQHLAQAYSDKGIQLLTLGDAPGSMNWFVKALTLDRRPTQTKVRQVLLSNLMRTCAAPEPFWTYPSNFDDAVFSPDGRLVAIMASGRSGGFRVYNVSSGEPLTPLLEREKQISFAAFRANGAKLMVVSEKLSTRVAQIWDVATGAASSAPIVLENGETPIRDRDYYCSADGRLLVEVEMKPSPDGPPSRRRARHGARRRPAIRSWRFREDETGESIQQGSFSAVSFSKTTDRILTLDDQGKATVWKIDDATITALHEGLDGSFKLAEISPDGRRAAMVKKTPWPENGFKPAEVNHGGHSLAIIPNAPNASRRPKNTSAGTTDQAVQTPTQRLDAEEVFQLWDLNSGQLLQLKYRNEDEIQRLIWSPDGALLVSVMPPYSQDHQNIYVWQLQHDRPLAEPLHHRFANIVEIVFSADSRLLAFAATTPSKDQSEVHLCDPIKGTDICPPVQIRGQVDTICFVADDNSLAIAGDGSVRLLRFPSPDPLTTRLRRSTEIDFSQNGRMAAGIDELRSCKPMTKSFKAMKGCRLSFGRSRNSPLTNHRI